MSNEPTKQKAYSPDVRRNKGISPLWILPILTMILAGWLVVKAIHDAGDRIQIYFSDAQGLVAGRTTIRYQGLEVGMVRDIKLSSDLNSIYVEADVYPEATRLLSADTRFWLVKPTASLSGVSGLDALVSGNYIAIQPGSNIDGQSDHPDEYHALDSAPSDLLANSGLTISLKASDLGGISIGSQIVYKKIPIGEVYSYQLDESAKSVIIQASIKNEYRHIITSESRFWNVSGVGTTVGFDGIDVRLESLSALIGGSIAVDSPDGGEPVEQNTQFRLYRDLKTAGRGIPVKIDLPDNNNINPSGAPIIYRGIEIGQITNLQLNNDKIVASAAVQPAFSDLLNSGSHFVLEEAKVSLTGVENLANLVKGNFLTLVPGEGDRARHFTAVRKAEFSQEQSRSVALKLIAESSFGLEKDAQILYRGVAVGSVTAVKLAADKVEFDVLIDKQYASLVRSQSRFYVTGSASAALTESGLSVSIPPAKQLLTGSISFVSEGSEKTQQSYRLYQNQSLAEIAKYNQSGSQTLQLFAPELPPVNAGSPLLYRNLKVGTVSSFKLTQSGVVIEAKIENQYKHLITSQTVFWSRSGVEVNASLSGVSIKAAPLQTLIQGGIEFDNINGVENKQGELWKLYPDYQQAQKYGEEIMLVAQGNTGITVGTPIKYNGVQVGEITDVLPDFSSPQVRFKARIQPTYAPYITKAGSVFWLAEAKVGLKGVSNLQNLISKAIEVKPGSGKATKQFTLSAMPYQAKGITFSLQSETRGSIDVGTPVLYRDIEVGRVTDVRLGNFADRVISTIEIESKYAYLVRENSLFWNTSGLDVSIGLSGANVKAGTLDSIVRGGITFATPEQKQLTAAAKAGQSFYLYPTPQEEWKKWRTAIPKP
ncbi:MULTISPECIES: MlaD family protein [Vibrio]|jgi:paraquat-inducible protein B|uniref:Paraquat-inducible protein B n=1 Tax=Vibrio fluvialis PG41 TaxID=1336752 RepID=S7JB38_VIBFL|nr:MULTISPECIES: MlaD family protein [Vibrio]TNF13644.1 MAG: MCE family protein [Vibrionaceae bacterium]HDM8033195.1 MCE family protein [Vibrio fluvialis clinical-1]EKO3371708.1 MCE family protein [Vibrio fluvialis]EKO3381574.1 MCE family protein [Vibrio fluvialis]EKO3389248.1 MCE family protein [Vibrio fluvialis]